MCDVDVPRLDVVQYESGRTARHVGGQDGSSLPQANAPPRAPIGGDVALLHVGALRGPQEAIYELPVLG